MKQQQLQRWREQLKLLMLLVLREGYSFVKKIPFITVEKSTLLSKKF